MFSMAYHEASLPLNLTDTVLVKPFKPTPSTILSLSTIDNLPDHNIFCQTIHVYQSPNHDSGTNYAKLDPAFVIKEALSKALFYYYPLAGKLVRHDHADGKLRINCNSDGVPFIEAVCNCELSSLHYLDGTDIETAKHLAFDFPTQNEIGHQYPAAFKVTKFLCGGFTIAMAVSHAVLDGSGAAQFLRAIAELASGKSEPSVKPVWERERLVGTITRQPMPSPMDEASAVVSPFLPSKTILHACFKVDCESIRRLKLSLMKKSDDSETIKKSFTTFESLAAYIWRSRARALKLSYDGKTLLVVTVGVRRHLLDPPLPDGYYGNAIVDANVVLTVRELNERPLSEVAKHIRESKKVAFTSNYIRNSINTMETKPEEVNFGATGASVTLTDWNQLGFLEKVDFGWKEPVNTIPAPCNMFGSVGLCIFLPPSNLDPSMKGGTRVYVSLPSAAMPKFKEEMEALRFIENA